MALGLNVDHRPLECLLTGRHGVSSSPYPYSVQNRASDNGAAKATLGSRKSGFMISQNRAERNDVYI